MNKLKNYGRLNVPDFVWWVGVVESRADITKTGRYRVRIMGYHTPDKETLPTKDLPYAPVVNSPTNASTSGIMENPNLLPGSTVIGFFSDGDEAQMPVILGSISGLPAAKNEEIFVDEGFRDPSKQYPRGGFEEPAPTGLAGVGEPDLSRLARDEAAETHYTLQTKREERAWGVRTASAPSVEADKILDDKEGIDYEGLQWEEPYARGKGPYKTFEMKEFTPKYWDALADLKGGGTGVPTEPGTYTSMYPFNQVKETEAGFTEEIDNTAGNERYAFYHPVGNYEEVQADGTRVNKIKGSDYEIISIDKNVIIRGSCNVTILGDAKMLVAGNKYEEVEGDYFLTVLGDRVTKINGNDIKSVITDENTSIKGNRTVRVALDDTQTIVGKQEETVAKSKSEKVGGNVTETFAGTHNTVVSKTRFNQIGSHSNVQVGGNLSLGADGTSTLASQGDQTIRTFANLDMDADVSMTIDSPTMSIDGPAGNITSNDVTLHTHTHGQTGGTNPDSDKDVDTKAPTSGT